ncbi:unnamed protein product [Chironomus riparius]|uniref:Leucine rich repeat protein n=1 Tax=Chironomus riparius TaxID=315576 RepID=A0A9P0JB23_9DIPT|nr:unnamed protein product [Chironomus riparius]
MHSKFLKFQALIFILINIISIVATQKCKYALNVVGSPGYSCEIVQNSNETHLVGFNNENVTEIFYKLKSNLNFKNVTLPLCKKYKNLEKIKLGSANLKVVDENSFIDCKSLNEVSLWKNQLEKIPENLVNKNKKLISLKLEKNNLTTLPENLLSNQEFLIFLDLSENRIDTFPQKTFTSLTSLQELKLEKNQIRHLSPVWFQNMHELNILYLQFNIIRNLPQGIFTNLKKVEKIYIHHNNIRALHQSSFKNLEKLRILDLEFNEILDLPDFVFTPLKSLQWLWLNNNFITIIRAEAFENVTTMKKLGLVSNSVIAIDEKFPACEDFDLSGNICCQERILRKYNMTDLLSVCYENYRQLHITKAKKPQNDTQVKQDEYFKNQTQISTPDYDSKTQAPLTHYTPTEQPNTNDPQTKAPQIDYTQTQKSGIHDPQTKAPQIDYTHSQKSGIYNPQAQGRQTQEQTETIDLQTVNPHINNPESQYSQSAHQQPKHQDNQIYYPVEQTSQAIDPYAPDPEYFHRRTGFKHENKNRVVQYRNRVVQDGQGQYQQVQRMQTTYHQNQLKDNPVKPV